MTLPWDGAENWLGQFFLSAVKASLLLGLAWLFVRLSRPGSAAMRHLIWTAAVAAAISIPLVSKVAPGWRLDSLKQAAPRWLSEPSESIVSQMPALPPMLLAADSARPWQEQAAGALWWIWAGGALALALSLALGSIRLALLAWRARALDTTEWKAALEEIAAALGIKRPVRLIRCREATMPVTWGWLRPRVMLPQDCVNWPRERIRVVLAHELAHVKRQDWAVQMLAEFGRAVYWFNPLIWIGSNRLRTESELAADDAVLNLGIRPPAYAEQLLDIARSLKRSRLAWLPALAVARQSNLERRLIAMLNPSLDRRTVTAKSVFLIFTAALCLALPLAALQTLSGKFYGTVSDATGGVVPNATVILSNVNGSTRDMTTTSTVGVFEFVDLPSGHYTLEVLKPGFARYVVSDVALEPNKNQHLPVKLAVGKVTERINVVGDGAKAAAQRTSGETPQRIRVGGNVQSTKLVHMERPSYPTVAKAAGIEGMVVLEAVIGKEGSLLSLRVMNSQIDPDLARAAVEAVSQWKYQPTLLNGEPVEVIVQIDVNFTLAK
ncbi:MAG: TonB family protein [Bryobacteraceae bacterium]|nr:TonB family protein [Bryobacteraceae bacterium]